MTDTPAFAPRFERAFDLLNASVGAGRIPGGVLGVIDRDGGRMVRAAGYAQRVPHEREMRTDTWFDLASLTKVIFTTTRILQLAKKGVIDLDAPLTTLLPDLRQYDPGAWERQVTFRQCLGHQTPFPAVEPIYTYGRDAGLLRASFSSGAGKKVRRSIPTSISFCSASRWSGLKAKGCRHSIRGRASPLPPIRKRPRRLRTAHGGIGCCAARCMTTIVQRLRVRGMPGCSARPIRCSISRQGFLRVTRKVMRRWR